MATLEETYQAFLDQLNGAIQTATTPAELGTLQTQLQRLSDDFQAAANLGSDWGALIANAVPKTRTVNGKALDADIVLTPSDVGIADYHPLHTFSVSASSFYDIPLEGSSGIFVINQGSESYPQREVCLVMLDYGPSPIANLIAGNAFGSWTFLVFADGQDTTVSDFVVVVGTGFVRVFNNKTSPYDFYIRELS